jgi:hypothetical protein
MQRYLVAAPLSLHAGDLLELTPEQAAPRLAARALAAMPRDGVYEVQTRVQFKAGEVIGYCGIVPKALATVLVSPDAAPAPAPAATTPPKAATRKPAPRASAPAAE